MKENHSPTLFLFFEQYKTPAIPYFCILKGLKSQLYFILEFK